MAFRAGGCQSCQRATLTNFISGFSQRSQRLHFLYPSVSTFPRIERRNLSFSRVWKTTESLSSKASLQGGHEDGGRDVTGSQNGEVESPPKPWYLQVDTPLQRSSPLAERQRLPDLPQNPPPVLAPVLSHLSVDIGLDDLTLLDLRSFKPPPALGDNLLMILGTARSEKHLHVSAERFCRWLRAEHKITAYADGLLGRGELKLKLRRKRRRARLLSRVGSSETAAVDDGIRTGWICVNIRNIEDGLVDTPSTMVSPSKDNDFHPDTSKANIVVQMFTQEKRSDLDLESLWNNDKDEGHVVEEAIFNHPRAQMVSSRAPADILQLQRRTFHSFSRPFREGMKTSMACYLAPKKNSEVCTRGVRTKARRKDGNASPSTATKSLSTDRIENSHLSALRAMTHQISAASHSMTSSSSDESPLQFRAVLNQARSLFPSYEELEARMNLLCAAEQKGLHVAKSSFVSILRDIQASFINTPDKVFAHGIRAILKPPASESNITDAISFVEHCVACGNTSEIQGTRSRLRHSILQVLSNDRTTVFPNDAYQRVSSMMNVVYGPASEESELEAMHACADADRWDDFWHIWRSFPVNMRARSADLYRDMFYRVALKGHQADTIKCLREWVLEMPLEEPPVEMDVDIATAIKGCLLVAEPDIIRIAASKHAIGEWVELWKRCDSVIAKAESPSW